MHRKLRSLLCPLPHQRMLSLNCLQRRVMPPKCRPKRTPQRRVHLLMIHKMVHRLKRGPNPILIGMRLIVRRKQDPKGAKRKRQRQDLVGGGVLIRRGESFGYSEVLPRLLLVGGRKRLNLNCQRRAEVLPPKEQRRGRMSRQNQQTILF